SSPEAATLLFFVGTVAAVFLQAGFCGLVLLGVPINSTACDALTKLPFIVATIPCILVGLGMLFKRANVSVLLPEPLVKTIDDVLSSGLHVPLFAAVGKEVPRYFDPDHVEYFPITNVQGSTSYYTPVRHACIAPLYLRIEKSSVEEAREALLATSALP